MRRRDGVEREREREIREDIYMRPIIYRERDHEITREGERERGREGERERELSTRESSACEGESQA